MNCSLLCLLLYFICSPSFGSRLRDSKKDEAQRIQSKTKKDLADTSQRSVNSAISVDSSESISEVGPLLRTEMVDGVAVVTLLAPDENGPDGKFPWGTRVFEHRVNHVIIAELNKALDEVERNGAQALMVIGEGRFFSNGLDLQFITANQNQSTKIQNDAENLLARILGLGMPTIAALNGHAAAAGAMLALAFDRRVMPSDSRGKFFVPGIDIGLVYSQGMTELMKAKLPQRIWNDVICMAERYEVAQLVEEGVVNFSPSTGSLLREEALRIADGLKSKGKDQKTRSTMAGIKANLYKDALATLQMGAVDMGFADGTFDATGRAAKA